MGVEGKKVLSRLENLETMLKVLCRYNDITPEEYEGSNSMRFIIERGLLFGSDIIFEVSSEILSKQYSITPKTIESCLLKMLEKQIISPKLCQKLEKFSGFTRIMTHDREVLNSTQICENYHLALEVFQYFLVEILEKKNQFPELLTKSKAD